MEIRRLEKKDISPLFDIHQKFYKFPFPDITNPVYAIQRIVEDKGKIILAGFVKITAEGIFITDKDTSPITRMKAIKLANDQMTKDALIFGFDECHTFAENDDSYVQILRKLGFQDATGYAMVKLK